MVVSDICHIFVLINNYTMPNYCWNELNVSGNAKQLKKFIADGIKPNKDGVELWAISHYLPRPEKLINTVSPSPTEDVAFANHIEMLMAVQQNQPMPKPIICQNGTAEKRKALMDEFGVDNWHDWSLQNWGCKWDCNSSESEYQTDGETYFSLSFSSAWSPPNEAIINISKMYPKLTFVMTYMEQGNWFAGKLTANNGEYEDLVGEPEYQDDEGIVYTLNDDVFSNTENDTTYNFDDGFDVLTVVNPFE